MLSGIFRIRLRKRVFTLWVSAGKGQKGDPPQKHLGMTLGWQRQLSFCYNKFMYYFYILCNPNKSTLYTGVSSNLMRRLYEHQNHLIETSFTAKYNVCQLLYYEQYNDVRQAIEREKQVKKWNRAWKVRLINKLNPHWNDLYEKFQ